MIKSLKEVFTIVPDYMDKASEIADAIYRYPSDNHKEMVAKIKDRLIELHEAEVTKIHDA